MDDHLPQPPRWPQRFIEWYCRPELAEDLLGDLNEYFDRNVHSKGVRRARLIYFFDAIKFLRLYTVRKPKTRHPLNSWTMIGSYLKTSVRNVTRNKLFAAINIVGLAISMTVGLLLIGFLHDVWSYDKFNDNASRIYRLVTNPEVPGQDWGGFATTSIKAGRDIRERATSIEELALVRRGFDGVAQLGSTKLPIEGVWAEQSLFRIFTLPFVQGNPNTALDQPFSIVLTETSARKFFGGEQALGKIIRVDTVDFSVTGVIRDIPFFSHLRFESLVSFATLDVQYKDNPDFFSWTNMWDTFCYVLLPPEVKPEDVRAALAAVADAGNAPNKKNLPFGSSSWKLFFDLQPLDTLVVGPNLSNNFGPTISASVVWILLALSGVVILSACFNYTNLSIARSIRRFKEVGIRKVIGAHRADVRKQFVYEAVLISVAALVVAIVLFLLVRDPFLGIAPELGAIVKLQLTPSMVGGFFVLALGVGLVAGLFPAAFFANVNITHALRDSSSIKVFKHLNLRRALVVVQYVVTLVFITTTVVGLGQYKSMLAFDLGFSTSNIFNVSMQGLSPDAMINGLAEIPEVEAVSQSQMVTSIGNYNGDQAKYKDPSDSAQTWGNRVDEHYFPIHGHKFLAGHNFQARPTSTNTETEAIVNEEMLKRFNIGGGDPAKALGEEITYGKRKLTIVGVLKNFQSGKAEDAYQPFVFRHLAGTKYVNLNIKLRTTDPIAARAKIEALWKQTDPVRPLDGQYYDDQIEKAYAEYSAMLKIAGALALLAITIASLGLFGMVVFTAETKLREISIRKVMGASLPNLILLLSSGFVTMLTIAGAIAIPATYLFFERVLLVNYAYHPPIAIFELLVGFLGVLGIALLMIGSQTWKAAAANPAQVLRGE